MMIMNLLNKMKIELVNLMQIIMSVLLGFGKKKATNASNEVTELNIELDGRDKLITELKA